MFLVTWVRLPVASHRGRTRAARRPRPRCRGSSLVERPQPGGPYRRHEGMKLRRGSLTAIVTTMLSAALLAAGTAAGVAAADPAAAHPAGAHVADGTARAAVPWAR